MIVNFQVMVCVSFSLQPRCKIDAQDDKNHTPLMLAVLRALKGTVELLVTHGAKINQEGPDGDTALHMAVSQQSVAKVTTDAFKMEDVMEGGEHSPQITAVRNLSTTLP